MDSEVFSEAAASILCLSSPACEDWKTDKYGDKVQTATVEGNGWRTRQDLLKMIAKQMKWAHVYYYREVFNRFASHTSGWSKQDRDGKEEVDICTRLREKDCQREGGDEDGVSRVENS